MKRATGQRILKAPSVRHPPTSSSDLPEAESHQPCPACFRIHIYEGGSFADAGLKKGSKKNPRQNENSWGNHNNTAKAVWYENRFVEDGVLWTPQCKGTGFDSRCPWPTRRHPFIL